MKLPRTKTEVQLNLKRSIKTCAHFSLRQPRLCTGPGTDWSCDLATVALHSNIFLTWLATVSTRLCLLRWNRGQPPQTPSRKDDDHYRINISHRQTGHNRVQSWSGSTRSLCGWRYLIVSRRVCLRKSGFVLGARRKRWRALSGWNQKVSFLLTHSELKSCRVKLSGRPELRT